ncbi:MAG TPA: zf-HC2 domain-containing protein [Paenibacillaceae bacterium]
MKCEEVMELMQRELDRDLNDLEKARMRQHLAECPECAELFARLKRLSEELEQLPRVVPPYSLVDAILPKLDQLTADAAGSPGSAPNADRAGSPPSAPRPLRRPGTAVYVRIAAAAVFGLVIGLWLVNGQFGQLFQRTPSADDAGMPLSAQQESVPMSATSGAAPNASDTGASAGAETRMKLQATAEGRNGSGTSGGAELRSMQGGAGSGAPEAAEDPAANAEEDGKAAGGFMLGFGGETPVHEGAAPDAAEGGSRPGVRMDDALMDQSGTAEGEFTITAQPQEWPSPDGRWIAYVEDSQLKVADVKGEKVVFQVSLREGTITGVEWEESGDRLRYVRVGPDGNRTAHTVSLADSGGSDGQSGGETAP